MYYIQDSTIGRYVTFNTPNEVVKYFDVLIPRAFNMSKENYIQNLLDLGYGENDKDGVMLTNVLSEQFNIGQIKGGNYVKCDIHETVKYAQKEYGD